MEKIIGISGSTVKNGVVEKALRRVLEATGLDYEIIRLHRIDMKQCLGCTKCAYSAQCILKDDINEVLDKIVKAPAVVFGTPARMGGLNSLAKSFFERLFPLFHDNHLAKKITASVSGGAFDQELVAQEFSRLFKSYKMNEIGHITVGGNVSCYKCGKGESCPNSAFRMMYGDNAKIDDSVFYRFENDIEKQKEADLLGKKLREMIV
ncbi:flavodoxin family protein [Mycoplasmatota bacterium]|nr:flavodoxin family protein [Mycoplasmatota bacterium]